MWKSYQNLCHLSYTLHLHPPKRRWTLQIDVYSLPMSFTTTQKKEACEHVLLSSQIKRSCSNELMPNDRLYYFDQLNTIIKNIQLTITDSPLRWEGSLCSPSIYHDNNESFQLGSSRQQYCPCQKAGAPTSAPQQSTPPFWRPAMECTDCAASKWPLPTVPLAQSFPRD